MNKQKLTVIIYTHNEEKNIQACIESLKSLTSEIVLVDMKSTDQTVSLAKKMGVIVYSFTFTRYVEPTREFGIRKAETEWVLILDADERVTPELSQEIRYSILDNSQKKSNIQYPVSNITAFKIPRKNIFGKIKWLKYGGWWPDYQIRLINKNCFKSWPKEIHSTPLFTGKTGYLKNPLIHYFHGDLESMVKKTIIFEDIESDLLLKFHKNVSTMTFFRKFLGELNRRLIKNLGFIDGELGIIESIYQAFSKTITYIYLYEKSRSLRPLS